MGLWDMFQGFGESLEDWGGGANDFGLGSINPTVGFMDSFKGLDMVGFPGAIKRTNPVSVFHGLDRSTPHLSEGYYQGFLNANEGDYFRALGQAAGQRDDDPFNIPLRNAQHGLVGQVAAKEFGPWGKYGGLFTVPAYNAAKYAAQANPSGLGRLLDFFGDRILDSGPNSLTQASAPSWESMWWGLRPWWGRN